LADPGGICVSAKVAREVEKKLAFGFEAMGAQQVKNIAEPVHAFRVKLDGKRARWTARKAMPRWTRMAVAIIVVLALAGGGAWWFLQPAPVSAKPSVAVLPFELLQPTMKISLARRSAIWNPPSLVSISCRVGVLLPKALGLVSKQRAVSAKKEKIKALIAFPVGSRSRGKTLRRP
jgi:hypothetical protein